MLMTGRYINIYINGCPVSNVYNSTSRLYSETAYDVFKARKIYTATLWMWICLDDKLYSRGEGRLLLLSLRYNSWNQVIFHVRRIARIEKVWLPDPTEMCTKPERTKTNWFYWTNIFIADWISIDIHLTASKGTAARKSVRKWRVKQIKIFLLNPLPLTNVI
jgi:hypothetical protein